MGAGAAAVPTPPQLRQEEAPGGLRARDIPVNWTYPGSPARLEWYLSRQLLRHVVTV